MNTEVETGDLEMKELDEAINKFKKQQSTGARRNPCGTVQVARRRIKENHLRDTERMLER